MACLLDEVDEQAVHSCSSALHSTLDLELIGR